MNNSTAANLCTGLFYDSGGPSSNHGNNENNTKTICTSTPGSCLQLQFSSFDLGSGDTLKVYDGNSTASPFVRNYVGTLAAPFPTILSSTGCLTVKFTSDIRNVGTGWAAAIICEPCPTPPSPTATYLQPTTGLQRTYVGANMVTTCGATFTDDGGTTGPYSNNINRFYRTFCPNTPGKCLRATFWNFDVQGPSGAFLTDYLEIRNGPTQNSTLLGRWYGGPVTGYAALMGAGLGPYVSTDQSGCLTFAFNSDASTVQGGWVSSLDCVPCASGPTGLDNSDCQNVTAVCADQSFSDASTGPGIVSDGGGGCVLAENYSNWYKLLISSSGTLGLIIRPVTAADDYDFALYAATSCSALGAPVRCSYAANTGNTGMDSGLNLTTNTAAAPGNNSGSDLSEDVAGNGWVNALNVTAGQTYFLLVNKWSPSGDGFTLDWTLANSASLNCVVLPVEWLSFSAEQTGEQVTLNWTTASESNNDHFTVERSKDGENFETVIRVEGGGTTSYARDYRAWDNDPWPGRSYYRLRQTDFDGVWSYSDLAAVNFRSEASYFEVFPNPAQDRVSIRCKEGMSGWLTYSILDISGRLLLTKDLKLENQTNTHDIEVSALTKGVYFITVQSELGTFTQRLVLR